MLLSQEKLDVNKIYKQWYYDLYSENTAFYRAVEIGNVEIINLLLTNSNVNVVDPIDPGFGGGCGPCGHGHHHHHHHHGHQISPFGPGPNVSPFGPGPNVSPFLPNNVSPVGPNIGPNVGGIFKK